MIKSRSLLVVLILSILTLSMLPNLAQANFGDPRTHIKHTHSGCKQKHPCASYDCCKTVKTRFREKEGDYREGCRAAALYVEGETADHSKSWHEGFTDCRFNVYRSQRTEREAEKTVCYYSPCCR